MPTIVSVHSYRGGTGKSNITANLAACLVRQGMRVGVADTDVQSPGIHVLFGFDAANADRVLNDYLWGECAIQDTAHDVTAVLGEQDARAADGALYLLPASIKQGDIGRILREGYDVDLLSDGLEELVTQLKLDCLLVDTHPGLHEETLTCIAISDLLLVILRPDRQDYQGTAVMVEVARKLGVPEMRLVINKVLTRLDPNALSEQVAQAYATAVAGVLPAADDLMALGSEDIFWVRFPDHPWSRALRALADHIPDGVGRLAP